MMLDMLASIVTSALDFLVWIKSKQAAYYSAILMILFIEGVLSWRVFAVYYDAVWVFTRNDILTVTTSSIALCAIFLAGSVISIHRPNNNWVFGVLTFLAITHDVGGIYFSVFPDTGTQNIITQLASNPRSTVIVIALSCLGLIPLTLSTVIEDWHNGMRQEIDTAQADYMRRFRYKAQRKALSKLAIELNKTPLEKLIGIIDDPNFGAFTQVVIGSVAPQKQLEAQQPQQPYMPEEEDNILLLPHDEYVGEDDDDENIVTGAFDEDDPLFDEDEGFEAFEDDDDMEEKEEQIQEVARPASPLAFGRPRR